MEKVERKRKVEEVKKIVEMKKIKGKFTEDQIAQEAKKFKLGKMNEAKKKYLVE